MVDKSGFRVNTVNRLIMPVMQLYGWFGGLLFVCATAYFLLRKFNIRIEPTDVAPLVSAAVGMSLFIFSRFYTAFYKERFEIRTEVEKKDRLISVLMREWAKFENTGRKYIGEVSENRPVPVRHILRVLIADQIIDDTMVKKIERALNVRNRVAHGMGDEVSRADIVTALDDITEVEALMISKELLSEVQS